MNSNTKMEINNVEEEVIIITVKAKKTKKPKTKKCKKCGENSEGFDLCEWCDQEESDIEHHELTVVNPPFCIQCDVDPAQIKKTNDICYGCEDRTCCTNKYHNALCEKCDKECAVCGEKHAEGDCEGVHCEACNDKDYYPLKLIDGKRRCSYCEDDYNKGGYNSDCSV